MARSFGGRGATDLLAISLSAIDLAGHDFGPFSQEVQDLVVRTDKQLGDFFDWLYEGAMTLKGFAAFLTRTQLMTGAVPPTDRPLARALVPRAARRRRGHVDAAVLLLRQIRREGPGFDPRNVVLLRLRGCRSSSWAPAFVRVVAACARWSMWCRR
ncbi:MAG: alkaline phosphatase family protein [Gammaproteobacteria bacterium]